jgi:DNA polymerase-3 subunit delta
MIFKNSLIKEKDIINYKFFLFYGENEGLKENLIKKLFIYPKEDVFKYSENEVINQTDILYQDILTEPLFGGKRLFIISSASEKIFQFIENIIDKKVVDVKIILLAKQLEKKSKLRALFEKEKSLVCVPFYLDDIKTLNNLTASFFIKKGIKISQESINLITSRCACDRKNLKNELDKIENYLITRKNISSNELLKLINLAEDFSINELVDNCLSKNIGKVLKIINENNFNKDDVVLIIRTFLFKLKKLLNLINDFNKSKNLNTTISNARPPIFWKDKEIVQKQIKSWDYKEVLNLIYKINSIEFNSKQNYEISNYMINDFILETASANSFS